MPNIQKNGLEPIVDENSRILILGTLPGDESLRSSQYYANSKNQIWCVLSEIYNEKIDSSPNSRLCFLRSRGIALWDVLKSAGRRGSLDSAIEAEIPNDFYGLLIRRPKIDAIGFNGTKAEKLFNKHYRSAVDPMVSKNRRRVLPSTSPTPGKHVKPIDEKIRIWKEFLIGPKESAQNKADVTRN